MHLFKIDDETIIKILLKLATTLTNLHSLTLRAYRTSASPHLILQSTQPLLASNVIQAYSRSGAQSPTCARYKFSYYYYYYYIV